MIASALIVVAPSALLAGKQAKAAAVASQELARIWDAEHVSPPLPPLLDHDEVERRLQAVSQADPSRFFFERVGASVEGRSINMISTGAGSFRVLLWSQMHGDEPTATAALFDVLDYLQRHRGDPVVQRIVSSLTLYVVPMLNPDGAERVDGTLRSVAVGIERVDRLHAGVSLRRCSTMARCPSTGDS